MNARALWILLWIAALAWAVILWLSGQGVTLSGLRLFASIPPIVLLLVTLFDRWLWRWPLVRRYLAQTPDVRGTWKGTIVTTWAPEDGEPMKPIPAYFVVRQTYFAIWARLLSERSSSETVAAKLLRAPDGVMTLASVYRNTPRIVERSSSPMHLGAFWVEVRGDPVGSIAGHYWTDRETAGEMEFGARSKNLATSYEQAAKLVFNTAESGGARRNDSRPAGRNASATKPTSRV